MLTIKNKNYKKDIAKHKKQGDTGEIKQKRIPPAKKVFANKMKSEKKLAITNENTLPHPRLASKVNEKNANKATMKKKKYAKKTNTQPNIFVNKDSFSSTGNQKNNTIHKKIEILKEKPENKSTPQKNRGKTQGKSTHDFSKQKKEKRSFINRFGGFLWSFLCLFFSLIFIMTIVVTFFTYQTFLDWQDALPPLSLELIQEKMQKNSVVIDRHGNPVDDLAEDSYIPIQFEEMPQSLIDGFVAAEDARFFEHQGIDGNRVIKALITNFQNDEISSGGSTITQQLIKLTSLKDKIATNPDYKNSNERKMHEWILAYELEQKMSKADILTAYANVVGYGKNNGVGTAAKRFFNKKISELTPAEATMLAGIPQSSTSNNPYINMKSATDRYQRVVSLLLRHNYITEEEAHSLQNVPLADIVLKNQKDFLNPNQAYFSAIEYELNKIFNIPTDSLQEDIPYYLGYKIYTAMDVEQQNHANYIMDTNEVVPYDEMLQNIPYYAENTISEDLNLQAAFAVVDVKTGEVPAIGAARHFKEHAFNYAVLGYRSPGSSIKPIIDYAPGVEKFNWTVGTVFMDKTTYYTGTKISVENFSGNASNKAVTMQQAIAESLNTVAVQAIQKTGLEYAGTMANNMGISRAGKLLEESELFEAAALGGGLETTPLEMAGAYATFGNNGKFNKPHFIKKIENATGQILYEYNKDLNSQQVMSGKTADVMTQALKYTRYSGTPVGGGRQGVDRSITFAAKTGTSSYGTHERSQYGLSKSAEKDHWIVGYSPEYSIAVWTGFNIENAEFLLRTRGNVNANKKYGSYIMASWMNQFAPKYTDFDFSYETTPFEKVKISSFMATKNKQKHVIKWGIPTLSYPVAMEISEHDRLGPLVFDVTAVKPDNTTIRLSESLSADNPTISYKDKELPEGTIIIIKARLLNSTNENTEFSEAKITI